MAMIMSKTMFPVRSAPIMPISLAVLSMLSVPDVGNNFGMK